jgi:signal transduction histidine kinase
MKDKILKKRTNDMIEAVMRVARGDYSVQVRLSDKNDELDSLAIGLNMMIDDLKAGTVGLEYATNRIEEILNVVQQVARGDYAIACKLSEKNDVFDALGMGVNMMIDDIRNGIEELHQVNEELEASNEELRATEEELRATNEELEASNEELRATEEELRTSNEELTAINEELRDAQEQLVRSEKLAAIGQLAGGVGHELRNPLGAIKNAVYYIKGKVAKSELAQKEPRVIEFLDIVDDEINSSNKIISDLLSFSRVGKPAVSPARIETVINDAVSHISIPESIKLTRAVAASLPEIQIDTDQIRQVLVNMITNAVQAMPEGGKLAIAARERDSFIEVEIADTGVGIPKEIMGKIFDPLYTTKAKGIGLGLAVCKSIIDRHEGRIDIESKMGEGTTFTIKLPLKAT